MVLFQSGVDDAGYTCQGATGPGAGTYQLNPGGATGVLTGAVLGTAGANVINGAGGANGIVQAISNGAATEPAVSVAVTNSWIDSIIAGVPHYSQPSCANLSGVAASCATDATNATNITSGTLPNARIVALPNANLANPATTVNGQTCTLGATCTVTATPGTQATATILANISGSTASPTAVAVPTSVDVATYSSTGQPIVSTFTNPNGTAVGQTFTQAVAAMPLNLLSYVNVNAAGYRATRLSTALQNSTSAVTVNNGSATVVCGACAFAAGDVGDAIVVMQFSSTSVFQSTIQTVVSGTQVTLANNVTFSSTNAFAYYGTDSTTAINNAFAAANSSNKCIYVPAGQYFYGGTGWTGTQHPCITGDGNTQSIFFLGATSSLVGANDFWQKTTVNDLGFFGGSYPIYNARAGGNVVYGPIEMARDWFKGYGGAAIDIESSDVTYYNIHNNFFQGQNNTAAIGVAILGSDYGWIQDNQFYSNYFHIKCGGGCATMRILNNDMLQLTVASQAGDIWIVPAGGADVNPVIIKGNKMGSENVSAGTVRMLWADTATSDPHFGGNVPLTTASTGYVTNIQFDNTVIGASGSVQPIAYSYTANVRDNHIQCMIDTTAPTYIVYFDPVVTAINSYTSINNTFGPFPGYSALNGSMAISNVPGWGGVIDPNGQLSYSDSSVPSAFSAGGSPSDTTILDSTAITTWTAATGTVVTVTDGSGGQNAVTLTAAAGGASLLQMHPTTNPTLGEWMHIDLDLKAGTATSIVFKICDHTCANTFYLSPPIGLDVGWQRKHFAWFVKAAISGGTVTIALVNPTTQTTALTMSAGLPFMYQSNETASGAGMFGWVNTVSGGYCMDGGAPVVNGHCVYHGTGAPSSTGMAAGSIYLRDDIPGYVYTYTGSAWIIPMACQAMNCKSINTTGGLTISHSGSGSAPLIFETASGTDRAQILGTTAGVLEFTDPTNSPIWGQISVAGFGVGTSATLASDPFNVTALGVTSALSYAGNGTATFAPQVGAGTGATAVCATSHICDSVSGEVTLTAGSVGTPATGAQLIITTSATRTNQPNCAVDIEGGTTFLGVTHSATTTTLTVSAGVALVFGTAYEVTYNCGGK